MLERDHLSELIDKKNLLAFSAGVDSTALFFLLIKNKIPFDIAIVNYNVRKQSIEELKYAKELASTHNLKCFVHTAPKIEKNFESTARKIRYDFFEKLIEENSYENLLTAHHLGDRFEWMLMQFCKGAGCAEIAGMTRVSQRDNYTLVRPLLHLDKKELLVYLKTNQHKYFVDESNLDEDIRRNSFRHNYSMPLLDSYLSGIKKSFDYLDEDRDSLIPKLKIKTIDNFAYFECSQNKRADIFMIDKYLKSQLYMMSASEREQLKEQVTLVAGRKFVINRTKNYIFIVPYIQNIVIPKEFKEQMRILKIEPKLRPYLYKNEHIFFKVKELFSTI